MTAEAAIGTSGVALGLRSPGGSGLPPGPRLPMPVQTMLAAIFTERYTDYCVRRYPSLVTLRIFGLGAFVAVHDPALIKQVFTGDP